MWLRGPPYHCSSRQAGSRLAALALNCSLLKDRFYLELHRVSVLLVFSLFMESQGRARYNGPKKGLGVIILRNRFAVHY